MRRIALALMLVVAGLTGARAADSDMTVVGGLDYGFKRLRLDTGANGNVFNSSFTTINPTLALGYKSFYSILSYERSISSDARTTDSLIPPGPTATSTTTTYSRRDETATLGYRVTPWFNVFAGYTNGVNEFTQTSAVVVLIVTDITYSEKGPFAGVSFNTAIGNKGSLGLSVAYAKLDSELKSVTHPNLQSSSVTGDNKGLSYGLTWSGTLTGSLGYRLGIKETQYDMEQPARVKERYTSFFIGISNYF